MGISAPLSFVCIFIIDDSERGHSNEKELEANEYKTSQCVRKSGANRVHWDSLNSIVQWGNIYSAVHKADKNK